MTPRMSGQTRAPETHFPARSGRVPGTPAAGAADAAVIVDLTAGGDGTATRRGDEHRRRPGRRDRRAARENEGTNANGVTSQLALTAGSLAAGPVLAYTVSYPYGRTLTYGGIVAYATPGGPYDPATFKANLLAKILGTAPNSVSSPYVVATAGNSTAVPLLTTAFTAAGGTDGAAGLTPAMLEGVPATNGGSGMYAFSSTKLGGLILAGCTDPTTGQYLAAYCEQHGGARHGLLPVRRAHRRCDRGQERRERDPQAADPLQRLGLRQRRRLRPERDAGVADGRYHGHHLLALALGRSRRTSRTPASWAPTSRPPTRWTPSARAASATRTASCG